MQHVSCSIAVYRLQSFHDRCRTGDDGWFASRAAQNADELVTRKNPVRSLRLFSSRTSILIGAQRMRPMNRSHCRMTGADTVDLHHKSYFDFELTARRNCTKGGLKACVDEAVDQ